MLDTVLRAYAKTNLLLYVKSFPYNTNLTRQFFKFQHYLLKKNIVGVERTGIIMNAIECRSCGDVVVSFAPRTLEFCKCGMVGAAGGRQGLLRSGNLTNIIERSIVNNPVLS